MTDLDESIEAWKHALESVLALGEVLTDRDWISPTECPGWCVKDVYSHLVGGELWMAAGHPPLENGIAHIAAEPVAARSGASPSDVRDELRDVFARRRRQVTDAPPRPEQPAFTAGGQPIPLGTLWRHRALDAWVHEQDIRRAVRRPGDLDSPGAHVALRQFMSALPIVVASRAEAPPGSAVRFRVDGPVACDQWVAVGEDGRGRLVSETSGEPTSELRMDWETFARLCCGRITPDQADVTMKGERDLAQRILDRLAITP